jgi:hypothetical protein
MGVRRHHPAFGISRKSRSAMDCGSLLPLLLRQPAGEAFGAGRGMEC